MPAKKILLFFYFLGVLQNAQALESVDLTTTKLQTLTRTPFLLKEKFTGEFLLLDFWASWCGPCEKSLPFYEELQKRYAAQGLQVLAISIDEDVKEASAFVLKKKLSLTFLWDQNGALAKSLGLHAIPTSLILDKKGKILHQERGFLDSSKAQIEQFLEKTLKKEK
ncbi:MAG: TlpA family protein disulfide reductase [Pseudobdellovibrionaceae bacterium]